MAESEPGKEAVAPTVDVKPQIVNVSVTETGQDDDPIVAEIPILMNAKLRDQLFLFQYPLRPRNKPLFSEYDVVEARVRKQQQAVELKVPLETTSPHFDVIQAEILAEQANRPYPAPRANPNAPSSAPELPGKTFERDIMDYYTLRAAPAPEKPRQYAVGVISQGALHLTSLNGVLKLKPHFNHLDESDRRAKAEKESAAAEAIQEKEPTRTTVTTRFKRAETAHSIAAHERSYANLKAKLDQEPWVDVQMSHKQNPKCLAMVEDLVSDNTTPIEMDITASAYLNMLTLDTKPESHGHFQTQIRPIHPAKQLSGKYQYKEKPLEQAVLAMLKQAQVLRFADLTRHFPGHDAQLISVCENCAHLIMGNWVVRSQYVFPGKQGSFFSSAPQRRLALARDYALWLLELGVPVERRDLIEQCGVTGDDAGFILEGVAVSVHVGLVNGWFLKQPVDRAFLDSQTDQAKQAHQRRWQQFEQSLMSELKLPAEHREELVERAREGQLGLAKVHGEQTALKQEQ
eukprot:m.184939 g.184939  ORF g.184939 m.184939 type:complete len:516 (+) comp14724_c0_seq3:40-1587(+)